MDMDQLLTFERIVREGSFSRAARSLDIAQPTISARVQALEQEIGGPLFVRGGRKISLTERGESFLPYCQHAIAVLSEGVETARLTQSGQRGRVTIGTMQSLAGSFLGSAIARFHKTHPQVEMFVNTGHSDQIVAMLTDGVVKLGLISYPFSETNLKPLLRFREPLKLMVSASHPLVGREVVTLEEVRQSGEPLFVVKWGPSSRPVRQQLMFLAKPLIEIPIDTMRYLLLCGVGVALLTQTVVADDIASGHIVPLNVSNLPASFRDSALVCLAHGSTLSAATLDFVRVMQEEADKAQTFTRILPGEADKLWL
ncbi:MAG TPA: LysR family transcriptional regulator [Ktedonosporobacter sp.]|nr:LysR family transcriptional regulator [Ktedonosporobacter sp.]